MQSSVSLAPQAADPQGLRAYLREGSIQVILVCGEHHKDQRTRCMCSQIYLLLAPAYSELVVCTIRVEPPVAAVLNPRNRCLIAASIPLIIRLGLSGGV